MANLFCDIRQGNLMFFSVYFVFNPQIMKVREGDYYPPCVFSMPFFFLAVFFGNAPVYLSVIHFHTFWCKNIETIMLPHDSEYQKVKCLGGWLPPSLHLSSYKK